MVATPVNSAVKVLRRGCDVRTAGSTYATSTIRKLDWNLDHFLICPAWAVEPEELGVSDQGVSIVQRPNTEADPIFDAYDIVGATNYPLAGFIEEAERFEISRKVDNIIKTKQFTLLDQRSRYFLLHRYAALPNFEELYNNRLNFRMCPQDIEHHNNNELISPCLGLQWEMMEPLPKKVQDRVYTVEWPPNRPDGEDPQFTFEAGYMPRNWTPEIGYGIFMWLPAEVLLFEIIHDPIDGKDRELEELLSTVGSNIPYSIVEE